MSDIPNTPDEDQPPPENAKAVADAELRRLGLDPAAVVAQPEATLEARKAAKRAEMGEALAILERHGISIGHLHAIVPAIETLARIGVLPGLMALRFGAMAPNSERAP